MVKNAIVGQSGGPTVVINASLVGVYTACKEKGVPTVYGMLHGVQGLLEESLYDLDKQFDTAQEIENVKYTPAMLLGSCRMKLPDAQKYPAIYKRIFSILEKHNIGYFFYIGGNDSMDTILKLSDYAASIGSDIHFIGVPKTIDNDLTCTDHTPGYGSAAKYIATTIRELWYDTSIYPIKCATVVEIMGRNSGWLTAAAALATDEICDGAAMICLPEVDFDMDHFIERVRKMQEKTPSIVIAVSEGIHVADGRYVAELAAGDLVADVFGHKYLSGTANYLCSIISEHIKCKTRAVEISTLQRCAAHFSSRTDTEEAYECGAAAARGALEGHTGSMVALVRKSDAPYACDTQLFDIHSIANLEKKLPVEWIDAENYQVRPDFFRYARPLIAGENPARIVDGLPAYTRLKS